jgi:hypothetical protein
VFTEPLPSNGRVDTHTKFHVDMVWVHRQQVDLIKVLLFFKIRKLG